MSGPVAMSAERWLVQPSIKLEGTNARISQRALVRRLTLSPVENGLVFDPLTVNPAPCRRQVFDARDRVAGRKHGRMLAVCNPVHCHRPGPVQHIHTDDGSGTRQEGYDK